MANPELKQNQNTALMEQDPLEIALKDWADKVLKPSTSAVKISSSDPALADYADILNRVSLALARKQSDAQNSSLKVRYEVAARVSDFRDLDDLLLRSLHSISHVVRAEGSMVWLINDDDDIELVTSTGMNEDMISHGQLHDLHKCMCEAVAKEQEILFKTSINECERAFGQPLFDQDDMGMIAVPLIAHGTTLGVFNLFIHRDHVENNTELETMLAGVARHLAMGIENARLTEQVLQKSIMEERIRIAHELHDSLAQSMASLRFQVRVLDEMLHAGDESAIWHEMERVEDSIEKANSELRTLITHFRGPRSKRDVVSAVEELVQGFKEENAIHVLFQKDWKSLPMSRESEIQLYRIVQEALANIKKHAQAKTVRVLMRHKGDYHCHLLVEDDGVGFNLEDGSKREKHFGIKIMNERAEKLGGEIRLESEQGEGTRLTLDFKVKPLSRPRPE